jgi:hypothetical protein
LPSTAHSNIKWSATARTDSNGNAVFFTNGKYKVVLSKTERGKSEPIPPKPTEVEEIIKWQQKYIDNPAPVPNYRIVELQYSEPATTPLEIEVVAETAISKDSIKNNCLLRKNNLAATSLPFTLLIIFNKVMRFVYFLPFLLLSFFCQRN